MDSQIWHDYCVAAPPQPPAILTVKQWAALTREDFELQMQTLEQWLGHVYVDTPELTAITRTMTRTVRSNAYSPPGAKNIIALSGRNLAGKSTLAKRWARDIYRDLITDSPVDDRGRPIRRPTHGWEVDFCPVVFLNMGAGAKMAAFDGLILSFFGLPTSGLVRELTASAVRAIQRHRTKVLVIDDAHFIKTVCKDARDVLDHIKKINTEIGEVGATLVLVGADLTDNALAHDPQIAGRMKLRAFPEYEIDSADHQSAWQRIVRDLENQVLPHLPAGKPGMLFTELAGELWYRTQGYLGDLRELVCDATLLATEDRSHRIQRKHLDMVDLSVRAELEEKTSRSSSGRRRRAKL
jgi:hypothetical protein